jgi:choline dehydrogenase-like flavoprotein
MPDPVNGFYGAPQSIFSDQFIEGVAPSGPAAFKLESGPTHPLLVGITLPGFGAGHSQLMAQLPHVQVVIALLRDGFHPDSRGGRVMLRPDGSPVLDYPISDYLWEGMRQALLAMAEVQFAAGADLVMPVHEAARAARTFYEARATIEALPMKALQARVMSAHVMGGCAMGADPRESVVSEAGRHHHLANLSVHDGSIFPTSVGANPQLSIYAQAARLASALAATLVRK